MSVPCTITWETMIYSHMESHEVYQQFRLSLKNLGPEIIISSLLYLGGDLVRQDTPFKKRVNRDNTKFHDKIAYVGGPSFRRRPWPFVERRSCAPSTSATLPFADWEFIRYSQATPQELTRTSKFYVTPSIIHLSNAFGFNSIMMNLNVSDQRLTMFKCELLWTEHFWSLPEPVSSKKLLPQDLPPWKG